MIGQAKRLSELVKNKIENHNVTNNIMVVASGKGGTGKSFFILNYAYTLSSMGKRILLIDLDSNLANIDIMLNVTSDKTIGDFLQNRVLISELPTEVRPNLDVIFGDSGKLKLPKNKTEMVDYLLAHIKKIASNYDKVLIDTGAGVQTDVLYLLSKINFITLIINPDPTSVMDGYALTKLLLTEYGAQKINVVVNKCENDEEGKIAFGNLNTATSHFLRTELVHLGNINYSSNVYKSIKEQIIFSEEYVGNEIINQIKKISFALDNY